MTDDATTVQKLLHDLRNPLAAIYTAISMVRELPPETTLASVDRHLNLIDQAVSQGRDLIDDAQRTFDVGANPSQENGP